MNKMRKYIAKDEEDLIKQIENDPELDKELEREKLVKGHVVEIRYAGKAVTRKQVRQGRNPLHMREALNGNTDYADFTDAHGLIVVL